VTIKISRQANTDFADFLNYILLENRFFAFAIL